MPGLMAIIGADANPMKREFQQVDRMARQAGASIQRSMGGSHHVGNSGAMRETMVIMREMSRGNWTRVPGSLSILMGQLNILKLLFKDTATEARILAQALEQKAAKSAAAAIAAKDQVTANLKTVASMARVNESTLLVMRADQQRATAALASAEADRVKAVSARQAATAIEAQSGAARMAISPLGWVAIALVAVGTAAYFTIRHFAKVREETKNLNDLMDTTAVKFSDQADAIRKAAEEAQDFVAWLKELQSEEEDLAKKTEDALNLMREQARLKRERASESGASRSDLAKMDLEEAKKELQYVIAARIQAKDKFANDSDALKKARDEASDPARAVKIKTVTESTSTAAKIVDAVREKMTGAKISSIETNELGEYTTKVRDANRSDKFAVEVDGKKYTLSMDEATKSFEELSAQQAGLVKNQKELDREVKLKTRALEKDKANMNKLEETSVALDSKIQAMEENPPKDDTRQKMAAGHVNDLQRVGAYAAPAVAIAEKQLSRLASIDKKLDRLGSNTPHKQGGTRY